MNDNIVSHLNIGLNKALAQLLFPQRHCLLCGALTGRPGLCSFCEEQRQHWRRCRICAVFLPEDDICPQCQARQPLFKLARAAWPYEGSMREKLLSFKYREQTWLRRPLALLMLQTFQEHYTGLGIELIIPAPLSKQRYQQRGYNQSQFLSQLLAAELGLAQSPQLLQRVLDTPPLHTYNGPQRHALLRGAYMANPAVAGRTVLLVDDIYTSGATLNTCSMALLAAGARQVYGLMAAAHHGKPVPGAK